MRKPHHGFGKQISANRPNATKSTSQKMNNGKLQSRCNATCHGLTAATGVTAIEDAKEFEHFTAAIKADYQPVSMIDYGCKICFISVAASTLHLNRNQFVLTARTDCQGPKPHINIKKEDFSATPSPYAGADHPAPYLSV
jgi:hypothetical protein